MSLRGVLMRKGAAVTFSWGTPGTYDPSTDTTTDGSVSTSSGYAMQINGDPDLYARLQLIESDNPTLEYEPDTGSVIPPLGATVPWGNETLTVKNVKPLAMNGTPTAAKIVVSR